MFVATRINLPNATAVELTAGLDIDQPTRVRLLASSGVVHIGVDNTVDASTGYQASTGSTVEFVVNDDEVWAFATSGGTVELMAWTE